MNAITLEQFNDGLSFFILAVATLAGVLSVISWIVNRKKVITKLTFWERVCCIGGIGLLWLSWFISNKVSERKEESASKERKAFQEQDRKSSNEIADLKAAGKPRRITTERKAKFVKWLEHAPKGKVTVFISDSDPEMMTFASDLSDALEAAGYGGGVGKGWGRFGTGPPLVGIVLSVKDVIKAPPFTGDVQRALGAIGYAASVTPAGGFPNPLNDDEMQIQIGVKP